MKRRKLINLIFIIGVFLILILGFSKTILKPKDINYVENRTAYQYPKFTVSSFNFGNYQNDIEKALSDQIPLSGKMKLAIKGLNTISKLYYYKIVNINNYYNDLGGMYIYGNNLLYGPRDYTSTIALLEKRLANINSISINNVQIYLYYIEKDTDINFNDNSKLNIYEYIKEHLNHDIISAKFAINNFDEFKTYFYRTDHHWNYKGSYKAYTELVKMLTNDEPLNYIDELCQKNILSGSKASAIGSNYILKEDFCAYKFALNEHEVYIDNSHVQNYGIKKEFFNSKINSISYGDFYGGDYGLLEFDFKNPQRDNLLIIGESYDNAINDLIASHFNKTYNVDLRNYENSIGSKFNLKEFIKEKQIDKVLLIGNIDYYTSDAFNLEGVN